MKNKIICLVLSFVFLFGAFAADGTYAWFMAVGEAAGGILHNFSSGNIGYTIVGGFKESDSTGLIEPEMELLADLDTSVISDPGEYKMFILNTSAIATQLRAKVSYTYFDEAGAITELDYDGSDTSAFVAEINETNWVYSDGYFYCGTEGVNSVIPAVAENTQSYIPLFSSLRYSGENSDFRADWYNPDDGEPTVFSVTVVFEAKQADYVEWTDLGEFTFEAAPVQ